jgi:hypothetical protein
MPKLKRGANGKLCRTSATGKLHGCCASFPKVTLADLTVCLNQCYGNINVPESYKLTSVTIAPDGEFCLDTASGITGGTRYSLVIPNAATFRIFTDPLEMYAASDTASCNVPNNEAVGSLVLYWDEVPGATLLYVFYTHATVGGVALFRATSAASFTSNHTLSNGYAACGYDVGTRRVAHGGTAAISQCSSNPAP